MNTVHNSCEKKVALVTTRWVISGSCGRARAGSSPQAEHGQGDESVSGSYSVDLGRLRELGLTYMRYLSGE
jgi:hypothetical protein